MTSWLRLWFGVTMPVDRRSYALSGLGLAAFKYAVEAWVVWHFSGNWLTPIEFVLPLLDQRQALLGTAPVWVGWTMFGWSLPFQWIAVSLSVRRASHAGLSPWVGFLVLAPVVNLLVMLGLCLAQRTPRPASAASPQESFPRELDPRESYPRKTPAALAVLGGLAVGALAMVVSVYVLSSYGAALFLGAPTVMSTVSAYLYNRRSRREVGASCGLGLLTVFLGLLGLLAIGLEGAICILMASPLLLPLGALGGMMGLAIANVARDPRREILAALLVVPMLAVVEEGVNRPLEIEVLSAVEIQASPQAVWEQVIAFPELPPPEEWFFRAGVAYPERARIEGRGVGATRYCEFSTGAFVEPITAWEPGERLAFDVAEQPAPMFELSPYRHVHPPHLDGFIASRRGEFRLIPLANGRTRLEGRTWYECQMFPQAYWTLWVDFFIQRIHRRVLEHVQRLAEAQPAG